MEYSNVSLRSRKLVTSTTSMSIGQQGRMAIVVAMISQNLGWVERGDISNVWGVIKCDNPDCFITVRPQTSQQGVTKQVNEQCRCGAVLFHQKCNVKLTLWTYSKGVCVVNDGFHQHRRPGHILHISKDEQVRFQALVNAHPTVGPLGLIVGVPGVTGPGESVADISDVFLNAGRVGKERLKLTKDSHGGGDEFLAAFAKFSAEHPGFVIFSHVDVVTVISVQSAFM